MEATYRSKGEIFVRKIFIAALLVLSVAVTGAFASDMPRKLGIKHM